MRLLLWAPWGVGADYSGPGTSAHRLFSLTEPSQIQIDLVHANPRQEHILPFNAVHNLGGRHVGTTIGLLQFLRNSKLWIKANAHRYDILYGLSAYHSTVLPAVWMERQGVPAIVKTIATPTGFTPRSGLKRLLALPQKRQRLAHELSAIVAISAQIEKELLGYGLPPELIRRIPNGVNTEIFFPANESGRKRIRQELDISDKPTLLFVGAITSRKRPHLLVEAIAAASASGHDIQLVLVGPEDDLKYAESIKQRVIQLDLTEHVIWRSFTPDIAPYYRAADIFALPSSSEGMPNALLEAMASGLPSLVTPVSGSEELIDHEINGFHVRPETGDIANRLKTYLENSALAQQHGRAALKKVRQSYSAESVLRQHFDLFKRVIREKSAHKL